MLFSLGINDDNSSSVIKFETMGLEPRLPYYVSLLIHVECLNNTVKHIIIDEGVVASVLEGFGFSRVVSICYYVDNFRW